MPLNTAIHRRRKAIVLAAIPITHLLVERTIGNPSPNRTHLLSLAGMDPSGRQRQEGIAVPLTTLR